MRLETRESSLHLGGLLARDGCTDEVRIARCTAAIALAPSTFAVNNLTCSQLSMPAGMKSWSNTHWTEMAAL